MSEGLLTAPTYTPKVYNILALNQKKEPQRPSSYILLGSRYKLRFMISIDVLCELVFWTLSHCWCLSLVYRAPRSLLCSEHTEDGYHGHPHNKSHNTRSPQKQTPPAYKAYYDAKLRTQRHIGRIKRTLCIRRSAPEPASRGTVVGVYFLRSPASSGGHTHPPAV